MDRLSIMFYRINPHDYPLFMQCERSSEQPGAILMESRVLQGIRYTVSLGYLLSILYFYGYHRPRLPFADRPLAKLHHYFYPSAGYSTPIGISVGLAYACFYDGHVACSEENVTREAKRERGRAVMAWKQHMQRQREEEEAAQKRRSWWNLLILSKAPASDCRTSYEEFLDRNGVLSVGRQATEVEDASFYQLYSKQQVDALVSAAMKLRQSPEEQRWLWTASRLGSYGVLGMLLTWNSGGMFFRSFMGLGLGVVSGAFISGVKLDS
ncbi:hypothetical protein TcG_06562 [Trypanosoma cruzi]|uniref:Uncharacterized protein n=2 Tax=Trypanosoma cruzi TaxID=5693 RepID=V5BJY4_TRYCR|nr:hypothetical protein TCDM_07001 [Trypanosoma cruzi Dm28c]PBJ73670.1 hypothetical protein BCY84_13727 [Trypanosoma cruzi cruzi]PWU90363.1 hypothetical protein C4B63_51g101 [Trypanosoma cruzi]RNF16404.1 hypothetical protein TcG_06562 [Trypanosoma cruzi]